MKVFKRKNLMFLAAVALLLTAVVGGTLAYVFTNTNAVTNTFQPSKVTTAVVENGSTAENTSNIVTTGTSKTNVQIKNTGDTDAYIRVAVVVNWMSADGSKVWATKPEVGTDYTITYEEGTDWVQGDDGYWYYTKSVPPTDGKNLTGVLINEAKLKEGVTAPVGTDGTQYYLSIEIVASGIQATPTSVVKDQWGVTVAADGTISK